jgi:hypothetical protein
MTALAVLSLCQARGVELVPDGGRIVLHGPQAARDEVRPMVAARKLELLAVLRSQTTTTRRPLPPDGPGERWAYDWRGRAVNLDKSQPAPVGAPTGATRAQQTASPILEELDVGSRFTSTTATEQDRASLPRARTVLGQLPDPLQTLREAEAAGRMAPVFAEQLSAAKERGPAAVGRLMVAMCKLRREKARILP